MLSEGTNVLASLAAWCTFLALIATGMVLITTTSSTALLDELIAKDFVPAGVELELAWMILTAVL